MPAAAASTATAIHVAAMDGEEGEEEEEDGRQDLSRTFDHHFSSSCWLNWCVAFRRQMNGNPSSWHQEHFWILLRKMVSICNKPHHAEIIPEQGALKIVKTSPFSYLW